MAKQTVKKRSFPSIKISDIREGGFTKDLTGTDYTAERFTAVAAGVFDGIHLGHRAVIEKAVSVAENVENTSAAVFTFDTSTVTTKGDFGFILNREDKLAHLERLGAEYVYSPDFSLCREFSAERFVKEVLVGKMRARYVVCGEDFRFGRNASGNTELLKTLGGKLGFEVFTVPPIDDKNGERISSTLIRQLISEGNISRANGLLGYDYYFTLPVISGKKIGRTLGFPTINQPLENERAMPKFGVYSSIAEFDAREYKSITNIGVMPTVSDSEKVLAETYIISYEGELYGKNVKLSLKEFIRPELKLDSLDELKAQLKIDLNFRKDMI